MRAVMQIRRSEPTPRLDRAFGKDKTEHFPAMGEALAGRRRWIWVAATRSFMTMVRAAAGGTAAAAGTFTGPRLMGPKYFSTSGRASAALMSPASTSTALLGP